MQGNTKTRLLRREGGSWTRDTTCTQTKYPQTRPPHPRPPTNPTTPSPGSFLLLSTAIRLSYVFLIASDHSSERRSGGHKTHIWPDWKTLHFFNSLLLHLLLLTSSSANAFRAKRCRGLSKKDFFFVGWFDLCPSWLFRHFTVWKKESGSFFFFS